MNAIVILIGILFLLMVCIGKERGFEAFFILLFNFIALFMMIYLICWNFNIIKVTIFAVLIITCITVFGINGRNQKSISAFLSVFAVILIVMSIVYKFGMNINIQGFSNEEAQITSVGMNLNVDIDFQKNVVFCIAVGILGAVIDVAVSIASAMEQVFINNKNMDKRQLFMCGISIGRDVLGAMINTMLFAYIGGFMTLILYLYHYKYNMSTLINSKIFCSEIFEVICSGIGIALTIPITAFLSTMLIMKHKNEYLK